MNFFKKHLMDKIKNKNKFKSVAIVKNHFNKIITIVLIDSTMPLPIDLAVLRRTIVA